MTPRWKASADCCKLAPTEMISAAQVACVKMGTTVATNALLERKGERTLLVITRGFRDALRIATQARPRLFDRHIVLPEMLYERVIEAHERVGAHGETIQSWIRAGSHGAIAGCLCGWVSLLRHRVSSRLSLRPSRARRGEHRRRNRLYADFGIAPREPADEAGAARRYHGRGRVSVADLAALLRQARRSDARSAAVFHAEFRRPDPGASFLRQGCDPFRSGRRHRRHGAHGASSGAYAADRF